MDYFVPNYCISSCKHLNVFLKNKHGIKKTRAEETLDKL